MSARCEGYHPFRPDEWASIQSTFPCVSASFGKPTVLCHVPRARRSSFVDRMLSHHRHTAVRLGQKNLHCCYDLPCHRARYCLRPLRGVISNAQFGLGVKTHRGHPRPESMHSSQSSTWHRNRHGRMHASCDSRKASGSPCWAGKFCRWPSPIHMRLQRTRK